MVDAAVERALGLASAEGVSGAAVTPYLLAAVERETGGRSLQANLALLESNAAFYAAQMTAMDTATKNSAEMIANLTLYMNKVRQAAITREIIEVVSGAEAL